MGTETADSVQRGKRKLLSHQVLACYDPHVDIVVSCDASSYGVGAVLSHRWPNGTERPVAFASHSLNNTEKRYSQLDKEALALVFGVDKFHRYVFGRLFTLMTDHKPLLGLFQEGKAISEMVSSRVQRWGLTLAAYTYHLRYRAGSQNGNADALSRLPLQVKEPEEEAPVEVVLVMEQLDESPVTAQRIKAPTGKDPCLSVVRS